MVKKTLLILLGIIAIGVIAFLISPLLYDRTVSESMPEILPEAMESSTSGTFVGLGGHQASGHVVRLQTSEGDVIRFEDDFSMTNGPDVFVYLGKNGHIDLEKRLSPLKGNKGAQNYAIPAEWADESYDEVWAWCRAFSVPFGKAVLR